MAATGTGCYLFRYDLRREAPGSSRNTQTLTALKTAAKKLEHWRILASALMPDHFHVLVTPMTDRAANISNFSAALKRWISKDLSAPWKWQPGCFDRLLRSSESLQNKWLYMQNNPVRAGLVKSWHEWPYQIGFEDQGDR